MTLQDSKDESRSKAVVSSIALLRLPGARDYLANFGQDESDERVVAVIAEFRHYCRAYYSGTQCEAALRYILDQRGPDYLERLIRMDDSKAFFVALREIVMLGECRKPGTGNA